MSNELKFKISANSSSAVAAFEKIGGAAKKSKKDVKDISKAGPVSKQWKEADKAVASYAHRLDEASKKQKNLTRETSKWRKALSTGLKWGAAALAGSLAAGGFAVRAAAERQSAVGRLGGSMGDASAAQSIGRGLASWGADNAADPNELLKHVDRLVKAGVSADKAVTAVKSSVIASSGDISKLEGLLEPLTEFASKGFIEEQILDKFAELGVDLRAGLQEQLGMSREQLDAAVASHSVTADAAIAAMARLTAEGTKLHDAHEASLKGMAGSLSRMSAQLKEAQISFGDGIAKGFTSVMGDTEKEIADAGAAFKDLSEVFGAMLGMAVGGIVSTLKTAANTVLGVANWVADLFGSDARWGYIGEGTEPSKLGNFDAFTSPETREEAATATRRKASATVAAERLAARDKKAAEILTKNLATITAAQSPKKRSRRDISYAAGFHGADVTTADLDTRLEALGVSEMVASQERLKKLDGALAVLARFGLDENSTEADVAAALENATESDALDVARAQGTIEHMSYARGGTAEESLAQHVARIRKDSTVDEEKAQKVVELLTLRDELAVLEAQEKKAAEIVADYERRMEIQDALLAGDKERADLLTKQAEAEKLANQYAAHGIDLATAQKMAAEEVAKNHAKPAQKEVYNPTANNVKLRETISSPLANIGGGGVRIRFYENQQLRAATDTAAHTADIATVASQILTHLQTQSQPAILA